MALRIIKEGLVVSTNTFDDPECPEALMTDDGRLCEVGPWGSKSSETCTKEFHDSHGGVVVGVVLGPAGAPPDTIDPVLVSSDTGGVPHARQLG